MIDPKTRECFLCEDERETLRQAMTLKLNQKINECTKTLNDSKLLAKLSAGDVIAQELKYHQAMRRGWISLPTSRGLKMRFHQPELP